MTILVAVMLAAASHPCMDDAKKLCPGVQPGQGRIAQCLKQHKDQLSQECQARVAQFREEAEACEADVQKLCPNTKPGPERHQCMQAHKDQVSDQCKQLFAQVMERREEGREAMRACRGDAQKFCSGVKPGEGRIVECLKSHQSDLSQACSAALQ